jgi:hypothetical protein
MHSVLELLERAASAAPAKKLFFYEESHTSCLTYSELQAKVRVSVHYTSNLLFEGLTA